MPGGRFLHSEIFLDPVFHKSGLGENVNLIFNIFYVPHESKQCLGSWPTKPL